MSCFALHGWCIDFEIVPSEFEFHRWLLTDVTFLCTWHDCDEDIEVG